MDCSEGDIRVHSPYDPVQEARRRVEEVSDRSGKLILFGAGLGYVLDVLRTRFPSPRVMVLEPFPVLLEEGLKREIWSRGGFGELVALGPEEDHPLEVMGTFLPLEEEANVQLLRWDSYERVAPSFFQDQLRRLNRLRTFHGSTVQTLRESGPTWLKHARRNLRFLPENRPVDPNTLRGRFGVVSAGPSLDGQFEWLRTNREHLPLLAGNTIGPALCKRRLEPDALVAVDARAVVYEDLLRSPRSHLILSPFVDPRVLDELHRSQGCSFTLLAVNTPITRWMAEAPFLNAVEPGGSITSTLVHWLLQNDAERLYLLGCDLEVTGGRYYARGTWREEKALRRLNRFNTLPGWHLMKKRETAAGAEGLKRERSWLLERCQQTDTLRVPPPVPSWWEGSGAPGEIQGTFSGFETRPTPLDVVHEWSVRQREALRGLIRGRNVPEGWQRFATWVKRICPEPRREYERWEQTFHQLEQRTSRSEV